LPILLALNLDTRFCLIYVTLFSHLFIIGKQVDCIYSISLPLLLVKKLLNYNYDTDKFTYKDIKPPKYRNLDNLLFIKRTFLFKKSHRGPAI
jgi:hypothetical protein